MHRVVEEEDDDDAYYLRADGAAGGESSGSESSDRRRGGVETETPRLMEVATALATSAANLRGGVGCKRARRDLDGLAYADARREERARAFAQYDALPASFFAKMRAAAGLAPRAKL